MLEGPGYLSEWSSILVENWQQTFMNSYEISEIYKSVGSEVSYLWQHVELFHIRILKTTYNVQKCALPEQS